MRILIFLLPLIIITGCKKEMPDPPTEVTSNTHGWGASFNEYTVSFYTSGLYQITVSLNGESKTITYSYNYNPGCSDAGCAIFKVPPGTYTYSGGTTYGTLTTGASQCISIRL